MKYILLLSISIAMFLDLSATMKSHTVPTKSIEIIIPLRGSFIECAKTKTGKRINFVVKGSSVNVKQGEYITLFLKSNNKGGYLRVSESNRVEQNYLGSWSLVVDVEISKKFKEAELFALVSSTQIEEVNLKDEALNKEKNYICRSKEGLVICAK